ncbi:MAG TPA: hypothetical protein VIN38_14650 [Thiobacillus sp.]
MTEKFKLDLSLVLPDVPDERDAGIDRLTRRTLHMRLEGVPFAIATACARLP